LKKGSVKDEMNANFEDGETTGREKYGQGKESI
jgi:hypothetical protein